MEDYSSAEGYVMLENENFPLSLLHFCNLSFQKSEMMQLVTLLFITFVKPTVRKH